MKFTKWKLIIMMVIFVVVSATVLLFPSFSSPTQSVQADRLYHNMPSTSDRSYSTESGDNSSYLTSYSGSGDPSSILPVNQNSIASFIKTLFGRAQNKSKNNPESILGTDNRVLITKTTSYPYRAITKVSSSNLGDCTGFLVGVHTVLTAGHCVYDYNTKSWAQGLIVVPGMSGTYAPYGSYISSDFVVPTSWYYYGDANFDYAVIQLPYDIGKITGYFGTYYTTGSLNGQPTYVTGYPGDKDYGTMWRSSGAIQDTWQYRLFYSNDTTRGDSGSPVFQNRAGCGMCVLAIHAYGLNNSSITEQTWNSGTRITADVYKFISTYVSEPYRY